MKKLIVLPILFLLFFINCKDPKPVTNIKAVNISISDKVKKLTSENEADFFDFKNFSFKETESRTIKLKIYKSEMRSDNYVTEIYQPNDPDSMYNYTVKLISNKKNKASWFLYDYEGSNYKELLLQQNKNAFLEDEMVLIDQKEINYKGKPLLLKKYYSHKEEIHTPFENVFISDSLGIVMKNVISHSMTVVYCYDSENLKELHNALLADTSFFKFKTVHNLGMKEL